MKDPRPLPELHDQVLMQLRRIVRSLDLYSKRLQKSGLTSSQLAVLRTLAGHGVMNANSLSRAVELSQGTVTTILDRLDGKGLIQRGRHEGDKRQVWVSLTEAGRAACENAPSSLHLEFLERFSKLRDWEQTMVLSALQRVAEMMDVTPDGGRAELRRHSRNSAAERDLSLLLKGSEEETGC